MNTSTSGTNFHKRCADLICANSRRHHTHKVFSDFCELAAISISNAVDRVQREPREARYLQIVKQYEKDEVQRFVEMLGCCTMALEHGLHDFMGQLYMSMELGNQHSGQFFTPYSVCKMMAGIAGADITNETIVEKGGFITMCEPACGAGAMIIATADEMKAKGINFQKHLHVTATDIDLTAVHMCYVQSSLAGLAAIIVHGNSLSLEEWSTWLTPMHVLGGWDRRLRAREASRQAAAALFKLHVATEAPSATPPTVIEQLHEIRATVTAKREQLSLF